MTDHSTTPAYTRFHWAKSDRANPERIHLLEHHLADVGACFEALLRQSTISQRLARAGELEELHPTIAARLCVLVALHDIGKVNMGFQTQIWEQRYRQGNSSIDRAGHTLDLIPVLDPNKDRETAGWFFDSLGWWWDAIESWDNCSGKTVCALFVAALSHHGSPLNLSANFSSNSRAWRSFAGLDPRECVERIGPLLRQWFPDAFAPGAQPLPATTEFQHHFLGLCTLADWIGSNEDWFPFCGEPRNNYMETVARKQANNAQLAIGLDLEQQRATFPSQTPDFSQVFGFAPNAIQQQAALETPWTEPLVIIESETGSGKTEAALWRFAKMYERGLVDGLYFALPTRAAASQIHGRVKGFVDHLFPEGHRPPVVLAVPGYNPEDYAPEVVAFPAYDEEAAHRHEHDEEKPWASENPKRYLAAQIAVGTVDQAMLGALQVRHAHLRSSCLARNLLVVDEVHASDTYMTEIIRALLAAHTKAGGYALLMSATLGSTARDKWLSPGQRRAEDQSPSLEEAKARRYPAVSIAGNPEPISAGDNGQAKTVAIVPTSAMSDFAQTAHLALDAARQGAKVLVVRNTVDYAIKTQQAVEAAATDADRSLLFTANGVTTLHHGRFARGDRRLLDRLVEERLGKGRPGKERERGGCIVVGTQTLEQSLDIDADLLITDLCPVDVLLQRIGRLHRHQRGDRPPAFTGASCLVLTPGADLTPYLTKKTDCNGLGPNGYVYRSLHVLEATLHLARDYPVWRIPEMNRELVEGATHPEALEEITRELGEEWKAHAINNAGGYIADRQQARGNALRFDKSFLEDNREILFPSRAEESIRTRLGEDRVGIAFDPQSLSPFDSNRSIERLELSVRWLKGAEVLKSVSPTAVAEGFEFSVGKEGFRYDRLGLRQIPRNG